MVFVEKKGMIQFLVILYIHVVGNFMLDRPVALTFSFLSHTSIRLKINYIINVKYTI